MFFAYFLCFFTSLFIVHHLNGFHYIFETSQTPSDYIDDMFSYSFDRFNLLVASVNTCPNHHPFELILHFFVLLGLYIHPWDLKIL